MPEIATSDPLDPHDPVRLPQCPHCDAGLEQVACYQWQPSPAWAILCVYCPHCRKVMQLQVVPLGVQAEQVLH